MFEENEKPYEHEQIITVEMLKNNKVKVPNYMTLHSDFRNMNNRMNDENTEPTPEKWLNLFSTWFFSGLSELNVEFRPGFEEYSNEVNRVIRSNMSSWEKSHQEKTATCAWLYSQFFSDATWVKAEDKNEN